MQQDPEKCSGAPGLVFFFFNNIFIVSTYPSQSKGNVKEVTTSTHECVLPLCGFPRILHKVVITTVCYKKVLVSPCI